MYCSGKRFAAVYACMLGRDVRGGRHGRAPARRDRAAGEGSWWRWWHGETLRDNVAKLCSHIHPFPEETGSLLAARKGGGGKFCTLVALTRPPGLSHSLFSRRKEISLCPQPGTENMLANCFLLITPEV